MVGFLSSALGTPHVDEDRFAGLQVNIADLPHVPLLGARCRAMTCPRRFAV
jgi:hypothetical protein